MWLLFVAWGNQFPAELADPYNNPYEGCSSKTHYSAVGIAGTLKGSIERAHTDISSQVYSSLQSDTTMQNTVSTVRTQNGSKKSAFIQNSKNIDSKLQVKTSLEFNHLITDELRGVLNPKNNNYYTLSCLHQSTLFDHIYHSVENSLLRFTNASTAALNAYENGDVYAFTKGIYTIKPLKSEDVANMQLLDAIRLGARFVTDYNQQIEQIKQSQEEILRSTKVAITFDTGFSQSQIEGMTNTLTNHFQRSILDVSVEDGCEGATTHSIAIRKKMNCDYGNMGYVCKAQLPSTIVDCKTQSTESFVITGFSSKSATDTDSVEAAVEKQIAGRKFGVAFEAALNNFLPYQPWPK